MLALFGCRASPITDDADAALDSAASFPWSNGASSEDLGDVVDFELSEDATLFSDTGRIETLAGVELRPVGDGNIGGIFVDVRTSMPTIVGFNQFVVPTDRTLRVVGTAPLVLASRTNIIVNGVIDASAGRCLDGSVDRGCGGPGGGTGGTVATAATGCAPGGSGSASGDTGGGGAGFGGDGGSGGNETDGLMSPGGAGGLSTDCDLSLSQLIGGSGGGRGGADLGDLGGGGGGGGGGVQLSANVEISIEGIVRVVGEGGAAGGAESAGGGGGSGGSVLMEAPAIRLRGIVTCNGGAGGQGRGSIPGEPGGDSTTPARGAGGGSSSRGGDGGTGLVAATPGEDRTNDAGGGGAAGGVVNTVSYGVSKEGAVVSPPSNDVVIE